MWHVVQWKPTQTDGYYHVILNCIKPGMFEMLQYASNDECVKTQVEIDMPSGQYMFDVKGLQIHFYQKFSNILDMYGCREFKQGVWGREQ